MMEFPIATPVYGLGWMKIVVSAIVVVVVVTGWSVLLFLQPQKRTDNRKKLTIFDLFRRCIELVNIALFRARAHGFGRMDSGVWVLAHGLGRRHGSSGAATGPKTVSDSWP